MSPEMYVWQFEVDEEEVGVGRLATAALREASERERRVQRYEFEAKSRAIERPMPRDPPVIRTCRIFRGLQVATVQLDGLFAKSWEDRVTAAQSILAEMVPNCT